MRHLKVIAKLMLATALIGTASAAPGSEPPTFDSRLTLREELPQGPFVLLGDGRLLTVDEKHALVSGDEGKTWERTPLFRDHSAFSVRVERALLRTKQGTLILAFMNDVEKRWTWEKAKAETDGNSRLPTYVMRSLDDGKTWEAPQKLHDEWTGAIRDMIETRDGRVVFTSMMLLRAPGRHGSLTYASDDQGATWRRSNLIDLGGHGHHDGGIEPTLVQLRDGRLWMLIRTTLDVLWQAYSSDGGLTWRSLSPTNLDASTAPPLVKRLESGRLVLLWNRLYRRGQNGHPRIGGDNQWSAVPAINQRRELSIAFSDDDGRSWSRASVIATATKEFTYPYLLERRPGELWVTTMRGDLRATLNEADFVGADAFAGSPLSAELPIRVACVGDSITLGSTKHVSYPQQLDAMLPEKWQVENFGHNGARAMERSRKPYRLMPGFLSATVTNPDVVVLMLGTNDAAEPAVFRESFARDFATMIEHFRTLPSRPRVWVCTPPPLMPGRDDQRMTALRDEIVPRIRAVAALHDVPVIDLHALPALDDEGLYFDKVHPATEGNRVIAAAIANAIGHPQEPQASR